jgi:hypothetical protein
MTESLSYLGLITSLFLPWLLGSVACYGLLKQSRRWNVFIILGQGYMIGILLTTLALRIWSYAGLPLHFWAIAITLLGVAAFGFIVLRIPGVPKRLETKAPPMEIWQIAVSSLLILLIVYRYAGMAQEIALRPLFPWDAWMNWSPKAVVWFYNNELTPFVSPNNWLNQTGESFSYTAGARDAWKYPATVPLIQLWGMLGVGTHDYNLVYLPWLFVTLALGLALYGQLRLSGASVVLSILACYALLNLPYFNVHTMLAGYADIWVTAAFGAAVLALHEWGNSRHWPYALLAMAMALMCTLLKIPGLIMGGIIALVLLSSLIKLGTRTSIALLVVLIICTTYSATLGIDFTISEFGRVALSTDRIILPYIGTYSFSYNPPHSAIADTTFRMLNWSLLWYILILTTLIEMARRNRPSSPSLQLRALLLTLFFIFFVYYFTSRYKFALDQTQLNRALLYSIPVMIFYIFSSLSRWRTPRAIAR